jgi:Domain of unknown function (DUF1707)
MALIGDRERERAAARLKQHYLGGRLSLEELTERLEVALTARRERDVRIALGGLPAAGLRSGLDEAWRAARRTAFVIAVWSLWWAASLVLLIGYVASVVAQGLSVTIAAVFAALWLLSTLAARRVTHRGPRARSSR